MYQSFNRYIHFVLLPLLLWFYAACIVFIWYGARFTPDSAILARVVASIFSDLVWIPFGFIVWTAACAWLLERIVRHESASHIIIWTEAFSAALVLFIFSHETAFAFLFVPLAGIIFKTLLYLPHLHKQLNFLSKFIPVFLILFLIVFHYRCQMFPNFDMSSTDHTIKVMSYNIYSQAGYNDRLQVIETIKRESPHVICFIEFNPMRDPELIKQELGDHYPYQIIGGRLSRWTQSAAFILSKYPLKKIRVSKSSTIDDGHVNFIFAEMDFNGRKVNIVSYHLSTVGHHIERAAGKNINLMKMGNRAADNETAIDMEKSEQSRFIIDTIATFKEPTILCGDLNDTPNSRAYNILSKQLVNTFSLKGWGLGATFGESWMKTKQKLRNIPFISFLARDVIRIDHIFVSQDIEVVSSKVLKNAKGSDHKPVMAVVRLVDK